LNVASEVITFLRETADWLEGPEGQDMISDKGYNSISLFRYVIKECLHESIEKHPSDRAERLLLMAYLQFYFEQDPDARNAEFFSKFMPLVELFCWNNEVKK
jgi:hypothetical protein